MDWHMKARQLHFQKLCAIKKSNYPTNTCTSSAPSLQRLHNTRRIVDPRNIRVEHQRLRHLPAVLPAQHMPQQPHRHIIRAFQRRRRYALSRRLCPHGGSERVRPVLRHLVRGQAAQIREPVRTQHEHMRARAGAVEAAVHDVRVRGDVRRRVVPREELLPGRGGVVARVQIVQDGARECGGLFEWDVADAWSSC